MQNPPLPDDILKLGDLTDASLLDTLQQRFAQKKIYAAAGNSILVSLNPFAWQKGLFSAEASRPYHAARALDTLPPHLFAIAEAALRGAEPHECVIVSGESGAGKTEATKLILEHFVRADALRHGGRQASAARDALHSRVLSANPVLEAFGNAKTLRNDNSSRFGKLLEVRYDGGGSRLRGVRVVNFLLERTRVSGPAAGERSFHVLYQLLAAPKAALPPPLRASLPLGRPEDAAYAARAILAAQFFAAQFFAAQFSDGPPAPSLAGTSARRAATRRAATTAPTSPRPSPRSAASASVKKTRRCSGRRSPASSSSARSSSRSRRKRTMPTPRSDSSTTTRSWWRPPPRCRCRRRRCVTRCASARAAPAARPRRRPRCRRRPRRTRPSTAPPPPPPRTRSCAR